MPLVACHPFQHSWGSRIYPGLVLELSSLDLGEIAEALADQTDYEHRWLINPQTGEIVFWTADTGIDGQTPVDLDELDLVCIDPLPSWVWYQDMADFAEAITDERTGRQAGAGHPGAGSLPPVQRRAPRGASGPAAGVVRLPRCPRPRRAVRWLADNSLIDDEAAERFLASHPDPDLP